MTLAFLSEIVDEPNESIRQALQEIVPIYSDGEKLLDNLQKAA